MFLSIYPVDTVETLDSTLLLSRQLFFQLISVFSHTCYYASKHHLNFMLDLPTSRAQIFHEREARSVEFLCFLRQKRAREEELDLFPLQKIASITVILARTICVPVACVVAFASCQSMSKQTNNGKNSDKRK